MGSHKILIVDDSPLILKAFSNKLKTCGYDVLTAQDGGTAVNLARQQQPDLIILDINFPPDVAHGGGVAWDGFLIINWLRRIEEAKDTPVIIITGADAAKYKERALAAGAVDFFHKPVDADELITSIRRALHQDTSRAQPA
jgi:DNA-binding response OmpR family regulator